MLLAKEAFLTKGVGVDKYKLNSFELALRDAGIAEFNLVRVSSIFPPQCKMVSKKAGLKKLHPGQILHVVLAEAASNEPNRLMTAGVGVAIPKNPKHYGYLSEHHAFGETEEFVGDHCEDLAASMLATILGLSFDPEASYDAKREQWQMSGEIVKTKAHVQSAKGDKKGLWTTVVSACVLVI